MNFSNVKYCVVFLAINLALAVVTGIVAAIFKFDPPSVMGIVIAQASSMYPGILFVKDHQRLPEKSETRRFAISGMVVLNLLSALLFMAVVNFSFTEEEYTKLSALPLGIFAALAIFLEVILYLGISWGFKQGAKSQFKALESKLN